MSAAPLDVVVIGAGAARGGVDAPARLGRPIEDTLVFAGEATSLEGIGTVEGALASGSARRTPSSAF